MGANLRGERVVLRAVEAEDVEFMYGIENDVEEWSTSGTTQPFSSYMLGRFVEAQREDIMTTRQMRLMITKLDGEQIGTIDLFEFDPYNHRAGVGIFISANHRREGYGKETLDLIGRYSREVLQMHQLWCTIEATNEASIALFRGGGYVESGRRRDWLFRGGEYHDEVMMQCKL